MTEIDILRAQIIRHNVNQPWGFKLQGGADHGEPLKIVRINPGSPAARIGLRENDDVTEIDNTPTDMLTYQEAINLIEDHSDSILLTIERKARGSIPVNPILFKEYEDSAQPKFYQTYDLSGAQRPLQQTQRPYAVNYNQNQSKDFDVVLPPQRPQQFSMPLQPNYLIDEDNYSTRHEPQSRTFKILQSVMENDEPFAGAAGLPPPRSASLEQMKREKLAQHHHPHQHPNPMHSSPLSSPQTPPGGAPGSRVKVFMPQQYNSPLAMYSADNVLETFTSQAENMLNVIEEKQNYGDEYEPLYSSNF